jgi:hypothetical protein
LPDTGVPLPLPSVPVNWRVEVQKRGRYWRCRTEGAEKRKCRYGGRFETLNEEKKQAYEQNKARRAKSSPITAQEAIEMLQSAIGYLQIAGITVQAQNRPAGLVLIIPNTSYSMSHDGAAAKFNIITPEPTVAQS